MLAREREMPIIGFKTLCELEMIELIVVQLKVILILLLFTPSHEKK